MREGEKPDSRMHGRAPASSLHLRTRSNDLGRTQPRDVFARPEEQREAPPPCGVLVKLFYVCQKKANRMVPFFRYYLVEAFIK